MNSRLDLRSGNKPGAKVRTKRIKAAGHTQRGINNEALEHAYKPLTRWSVCRHAFTCGRYSFRGRDWQNCDLKRKAGADYLFRT
jgi:hypothetical protein